MSGEIVKADDLEAITAELGVNMPAEKMIIQADIVRDKAYAAADRASDLLMGLSSELLSALNGKMFEESITTYHGRHAVVRAKGKSVTIDAKTYGLCVCGDGFLVKLKPSKGKIIINLESKQSTAKKMPLIMTLAASVTAGTLLLGPLGTLFGAFVGLLPAVESNCRGLPLVNYDTEKIFKDYEHFAYSQGISSDEARQFFDDYIALPGAVYGAMENVMGRNRLLAQDIDAKHNELRLLEAKLR